MLLRQNLAAYVLDQELIPYHLRLISITPAHCVAWREIYRRR